MPRWLCFLLGGHRPDWSNIRDSATSYEVYCTRCNHFVAPGLRAL